MNKHLRLTSVFIFILGIFLISSVSAFSGSGSGTSVDPFQITSWAELNEVRDNLTASYILMNDLNLSTTGYDTYASPSANAGLGWNPIGSGSDYFNGKLDGDCYSIEDIFINRTTQSLGLFGQTSSDFAYETVIENVNVGNITIWTNNANVGGLIGLAVSVGQCSISNVSVTGEIHPDAGAYIGGLVGYSNMGGSPAKFSVENSFANVSILPQTSNYIYSAGGFIGYIQNSNSSVIDCYSIGLVNVSNGYYGGFTASSSATTTNSFWDTETSGQATSGGSEVGKTTAQMQTLETFSSWDIIDVADSNSRDTSYIWNIANETAYPFFSWKIIPPVEPTYISDCVTELNESGTTYVLISDLYNCSANIDIEGSNITLDGNGHYINGSSVRVYNSGFGYGNNTIKNILFDEGIILLFNSTNNLIYNNTFLNSSINAQVDSNSNVITNNVFNSCESPIYITNSDSNNITHNIVLNSEEYGIFIYFGDNNYLENNTIQNSTTNDIYMGGSSAFNKFFNNDILSYSFAAYVYPIFQTLFGEIAFLNEGDVVVMDGNNLTADISITNNLGYVNIENVPSLLYGYNLPVNLTLVNASSYTHNLQILKDGVACSDCVNLTPLTAESVKFYIPNWNGYNYTIGTYQNTSLYSPENDSVYQQSVNFISNFSDYINLSNATLYIWNITGELINTSSANLTGFSNSTNTNYNFSESGTYLWNFKQTNIEDISNFASTNRTIFIDVNKPAITLNYPKRTAYINNGTNVQFNSTATGDNLDTMFLYGNFSGNYSLVDSSAVTSSVKESFVVSSLNEGVYSWTTAVNQSTGDVTYSQNGNFTLYVDFTNPSIIINSISTAAGHQTFSFNSTATDNYAVSSCYYSIYNSAGVIDGLNSNISFDCNEIATATTSTYGSFNLTTWVEDEAGNLAGYIYPFTTSAISGGTSTGGGTTIIYYNWSMFSAGKSSQYELIMAPATKRTLSLEFRNDGDYRKNITLSCDDEIGKMCQYVEFANKTFTLMIYKNVAQLQEFEIKLPADIPSGNYKFNIIAKDKEGLQRVVNVYVEIGVLSVFYKFFYNMFEKSQVLGILNIFVFLPSLIIIFWGIGKFPDSKKMPFSGLWRMLFGIGGATLITWFLM